MCIVELIIGYIQFCTKLSHLLISKEKGTESMDGFYAL